MPSLCVAPLIESKGDDLRACVYLRSYRDGTREECPHHLFWLHDVAGELNYGKRRKRLLPHRVPRHGALARCYRTQKIGILYAQRIKSTRQTLHQMPWKRRTKYRPQRI